MVSDMAVNFFHSSLTAGNYLSQYAIQAKDKFVELAFTHFGGSVRETRMNGSHPISISDIVLQTKKHGSAIIETSLGNYLIEITQDRKGRFIFKAVDPTLLPIIIYEKAKKHSGSLWEVKVSNYIRNLAKRIQSIKYGNIQFRPATLEASSKQGNVLGRLLVGSLFLSSFSWVVLCRAQQFDTHTRIDEISSSMIVDFKPSLEWYNQTTFVPLNVKLEIPLANSTCPLPLAIRTIIVPDPVREDVDTTQYLYGIATLITSLCGVMIISKGRAEKTPSDQNTKEQPPTMQSEPVEQPTVLQTDQESLQTVESTTPTESMQSTTPIERVLTPILQIARAASPILLVAAQTDRVLTPIFQMARAASPILLSALVQEDLQENLVETIRNFFNDVIPTPSRESFFKLADKFFAKDPEISKIDENKFKVSFGKKMEGYLLFKWLFSVPKEVTITLGSESGTAHRCLLIDPPIELVGGGKIPKIVFDNSDKKKELKVDFGFTSYGISSLLSMIGRITTKWK